MRSVIAQFSIMGCLIILAAPASGSGSALAQAVLPDIVTISMFNTSGDPIGIGSGFRIGGGDFVTNAHVVAGGAWAEITSTDGVLLGTASYAVLVDLQSDLAVLTLPQDHEDGLFLAASPVEIGEDIWVFGAPLGLDGTVSAGIVSGTRSNGVRDYIQITAPVSPGSSGGPVVDRYQRVVGVVVSMIEEGQNLNFAIPVAAMANLLHAPRGRHEFSELGKAATQKEEHEPEIYSLAYFLVSADSIPDSATCFGTLDESDHRLEGRPYDFYAFEGDTGQSVVITVDSSEMDPQVAIVLQETVFSEDLWFREDDDGGSGTNARIECTLPFDGIYNILVSSYGDAQGDYQLNLNGKGRGGGRSDSSGRWILISENENYNVYFDTLTVESERRYSTGWFRYDMKNEKAATSGKQYDRELQRVRFNCEERTYSIITDTLYLGGNVVESYDHESWEKDWDYVIPDTVGEVMSKIICDHE